MPLFGSRHHPRIADSIGFMTVAAEKNDELNR